jgi:hypothetical protein
VRTGFAEHFSIHQNFTLVSHDLPAPGAGRLEPGRPRQIAVFEGNSNLLNAK